MVARILLMLLIFFGQKYTVCWVQDSAGSPLPDLLQTLDLPLIYRYLGSVVGWLEILKTNA